MILQPEGIKFHQKKIQKKAIKLSDVVFLFLRRSLLYYSYYYYITDFKAEIRDFKEKWRRVYGL